MNIATRFLLELQEMSLLVGRAARGLFKKPRYIPETIAQMDSIGVGSLTIILLTGFFTGGVLTLQTYQTLASYGAVDQLGYLVSISLVRELGPVLTALMVTGRVVSAISAELGSMVVSEQIDAMRALGTDPIRKLMTPRVLATLTMLPLLVAVFDFVGLIGGFVVAYFTLRLGAVQFWTRAIQALELGDLVQGGTKPIIFGLIIATVGCYQGLRVKGGTQGVGRATTTAVVVSSVFVLVVDFFLARLLLFMFHK